MILCCNECIPCCDFCKYVIHDFWLDDNCNVVKGGPIGCRAHEEELYQKVAEAAGYCSEFHCTMAKEDDFDE